MTLARTVRQTVRGPVRDRLRWQQSRLPLLRGAATPGPPDFVGIGVQRCGTSWWHAMIESHPAVASLGYGAKELHFFDQWWSGDFGPEQIERYHSNFLRGPGQLAGEWTPRYLYDPWAVPLLMQAAPQAQAARPAARPGCAVPVRAETCPCAGLPLDADTVDTAFQRGCLRRPARTGAGHGPRTQLLVLQFERCVRETRRMLGATFDFLGVAGHGGRRSPRQGTPSMHLWSCRRTCCSRSASATAWTRPGLVELFGDDFDAGLWAEAALPG